MQRRDSAPRYSIKLTYVSPSRDSSVAGTGSGPQTIGCNSFLTAVPVTAVCPSGEAALTPCEASRADELTLTLSFVADCSDGDQCSAPMAASTQATALRIVIRGLKAQATTNVLADSTTSPPLRSQHGGPRRLRPDLSLVPGQA